MDPTQAPRRRRSEHSPELDAEYERIGRERGQASREADRAYRWELVRVCLELVFWMVAGAVIGGFGFHVNDVETGWILIYTGMLVNAAGVLWSIATAYQRGVERGDW